MSYLTFVLKERRLLSFGLSFTFFSSFGQTFLISLFVPYFLQEFQLSNAGFGSLYSAATLTSAAVLPWLGKWIDHIPLRLYSTCVAVGLVIASFMVAISWHVGLLFVGLLLLRLAGQGLSSHTAQTAMAKFYDHQRGKALSISNLGYPIGEAILPLGVTALLTVFHWRMTWATILLIIACIMIPFIHIILRKEEGELEEDNQTVSQNSDADYSYMRILSDYRFYFLFPAVLLPPFWATGFFLYQVSVAESLGWTATLIASAFVMFAVARILSSLGVGPLIDLFKARTIFPYYMLPMAAGFVFAFYHPGSWSAFVYMALLGATMGMGGAIKSALWAELYGTKTVGTVRSMFSALMVFSSALSPFMMGWLIDNGTPMTTILFWAVITTLVGTLLAMCAFSSRVRLFFSRLTR
ncbi:MFS transporter [Halalkalibaculum sp. DA384]|uniref:MFS transporter n=1 Tax=Halalkalibaculum sp. DA384 TaxID=3373606 RepID=UPI0037547FC8